MKNYTIIVCLFLCLLTSCAVGVETGTPDEKKQKQLTTLEIQEKASTDTVLYKVYEKENTIYLINPKTNVVAKTVDLSYLWVINLIAVVFFLLFLAGAYVMGSNY